MSSEAYREIIAAAPRERLDLFLAAANRLGAPVGNVEKDFWVCWTLNALYHRLPKGGPPPALMTHSSWASESSPSAMTATGRCGR